MNGKNNVMCNSDIDYDNLTDEQKNLIKSLQNMVQSDSLTTPRELKYLGTPPPPGPPLDILPPDMMRYLCSFLDKQSLLTLQQTNEYFRYLLPTAGLLSGVRYSNNTALYQYNSPAITHNGINCGFAFSIAVWNDPQFPEPLLVTSHNEGIIRIWDLNGNLNHNFQHPDQKDIRALLVLPGKKLAGASEHGKIYIWNTNTGALEKTIPTNSSISCMIFIYYKGEPCIVSADPNGIIHFWNYEKSMSYRK